MKGSRRLSTLLLTAISGWLMAANPGDVMRTLGIETSKLRQDVLLNLKEPRWFFFNTTNSMRQLTRQLPEASRAATVRSLGSVVRAYVESSAFKNAWLQDLRTAYPYDVSYTDEALAKKKLDQEAEQSAMNVQLTAMNQAFAQMDPATLKMAAQAQIMQAEQKIASLEGSERARHAQRIGALKKMLAMPPVEFKKQYLASLKQQAIANVDTSIAANEVDKEELAQQRRQKAEFDAHADFRPLLKKRLEDFIALSESVDFEARLVPMGRKQVFANPVYERKCAEWKFLYRLGNEPVAEARLVARQWLAELPE